jgi:hypothetical protein
VMCTVHALTSVCNSILTVHVLHSTTEFATCHSLSVNAYPDHIALPFVTGVSIKDNMASVASTSSKSTSGQQSRIKRSQEDIEATPHREPSASTGQPDEKDAAPEDGVPAIPFSPGHEMLFVFMICMAQFLSLAGLAQSIAPMEIIGRSFGITDEATLSWYPASFSLTYGTFILPAGRLVSLDISCHVFHSLTV